MKGPRCYCRAPHPNAPCPELEGKWCIRRDGYCWDTTRPWTVWRWVGALHQYVSWATAETLLDAVDETSTLMDRYGGIGKATGA